MFIEGCEQLRECVNRIVVKDLKVPLVSTINQSYLYHSEDLKKELVCNMYSKMLWRKSIEIVSLSQPVEFIEVGLGKSISKASKLIKSGNTFYSYDSIFK
jgi:malonyl CoA-acyl carrier protein transacylase